MCDFSVFAVSLDEAQSVWEGGLSDHLSATMGRDGD
jgi:hypothetical protein